MTSNDLVDRELRHNRRAFSRLLDVAEAKLRRRKFSSAVQWCRIAANFAMTNATAELRSERLEAILDLVADLALAPSSAQVPAGAPRRVLHVVTEAAAFGGLPRFAARWMSRDSSSCSSVVVTHERMVQEALSRTALDTGGVAVALGVGDPVARARELRWIAGDADLIVCHLQPDDPVPAVAFGPGYTGPPVAVVNHADHLFLVAPTGASLFVDFRSVGSELSKRGRGYSPDSMFQLPLLVPTPGLRLSRELAREALGIDPGSVVAVSLARPVKFQDTRVEPRFSDMVASALEANPALTLCAVGPQPHDEPWPGLLARFPNQLLVTGPVADPSGHLAAADLYVDPFPFSSLTSLLEASNAGVPVVTLDGHAGLCRTFGIADYVGPADDRPTEASGLLARITTLVDDAQARLESGLAARRTYDDLTPEASWLHQLEAMYAAMVRAHDDGSTIGLTTPPSLNQELIEYGRSVLAIEVRTPLLWTVMAVRPDFPRREQRSLWLRGMSTRVVRKAASLLGRPPWPSDQVVIPFARKRPFPDTPRRLS